MKTAVCSAQSTCVGDVSTNDDNVVGDDNRDDDDVVVIVHNP